MKNLLRASPLGLKIRDQLPALDIQIWSAVFVGAAAVAALVVMVTSLGRGPPPVQAGSRKGDRAEIFRDIGPRTVLVQRIKPEPEPQMEQTWLQTPLPTHPLEASVWPANSPPPSKPVAKPDKLDKAEQLCAKHNMKKVWINSKQWRCRKR